MIAARKGGHPVVAATLDLAMWSLRGVRRRLLPEARGRVLEIGCGTGANLPFYTDAERVVAIEPDPHMLRRARRKAARAAVPVELLRGSAEDLPFADASFDTVVATWVLCTIPHPERAAREMRRVLHPDGALLFAEHTRAAGPRAAGLQHALNPAWARIAGGCHLDRDALGILAAAGFRDLEVEPIGRQSWTLLPMLRGSGRR